MKLIFLGPPGAGKGTIAAEVSKEYGIPHISTGDLFRKAIKEESELGLRVKAIIDAGNLVPDSLTVDLVKERLSLGDTEKGFILDGFPRTIPQADALAAVCSIDNVVNFNISDEKIIKRLAGRRLCSKCGKGYHIENIKPEKEGICDSCGGELYTRPDDAPEAIMNRLDVYRKQTEPLINYYSEKGLLVDVDGTGSIDTVLESTLKVLG